MDGMEDDLVHCNGGSWCCSRDLGWDIRAHCWQKYCL